MIPIRNGIIKHVNVNAKIIVIAKMIIVGILECICGNSRYLKIISDDSKIVSDDIM